MKKTVASLILAGLTLMSNAAERPAQRYDTAIRNLIVETRKSVRDRNNDGLVNCIDYATTFKYLWDQKYTKIRCELVRNYNEKTGMNHLFARVKFAPYHDWTYVETWAISEYVYDIETIWRDAYSPAYNYYGETYYWMHEANYW